VKRLSWWIELYNCQTYDQLVELCYRHLSMPKQAMYDFLEHTVSALIPGWRAVALQHLAAYRQFVQHWLTDALTDDDFRRAEQWAQERREPVSAWLLKAPSEFAFDAWMSHEYQRHPYQLFEVAYHQALHLIRQERDGRLPYRPQCCGICGAVFLPDRRSQRWCSTRCRNQALLRRRRHEPSPPPAS